MVSFWGCITEAVLGKDTLRGEGGHGSLSDFGNSPMEIGHWAEAGISRGFGTAGAKGEAQLGKPQDGGR